MPCLLPHASSVPTPPVLPGAWLLHGCPPFDAPTASQFLIGLIKCAVNRFMLSGELTDVSDTLDRLLATVVGVAARGVLQKDPDEIRRTAFYTEPACTALKLVDGTLKRCFGKLAALDVPPPSSPPPPKAPSNRGATSTRTAHSNHELYT